jgi:hypothetical protein
LTEEGRFPRETLGPDFVGCNTTAAPRNSRSVPKVTRGLFGIIENLRTLFAEMAIEEARDFREHLLCLGRVRVEIVLGVRHTLVDLKFRFDAGPAKLGPAAA